MAERYTRLFALTENLYQNGSPVFIAAGALLKDTQTGRVLAQLKLQSLSDKPIKAAKISITPLDVVGNELGETVEQQYLDLYVRRGGAFGSKSPVTLPDATTRAFRATVTSVVFEDNTVWTASDAAWEPLPAPVPLDEAYPDSELRKQFKLKFGDCSQYAYAEFADLCRCPCGALNRQSEARCRACGCDLGALRVLDLGKLEAQKNERLEQEKRAEEEAAFEAATRAKKVKKYTIIASSLALVVIILLIIFVPMMRYNHAVTLAREGMYTEAYNAFEAMGQYRDSAEKALSVFALSEQEAIKSADIGDYVFFGSYEQDNRTSNGQEKIEWLVLDIQNGKALLLSKYALDCQPVHTGDTYRAWKTCSLFEWLNSDFLNTAFSDGEQMLLVKYDGAMVSMLERSDASAYFTKKTSYHSKSEMLCEPTAYAVSNGALVDSDTGYCGWQLVPDGSGSGKKTFGMVYPNGTIMGTSVSPSYKRAIRPTIWVDLSE